MIRVRRTPKWKVRVDSSSVSKRVQQAVLLKSTHMATGIPSLSASEIMPMPAMQIACGSATRYEPSDGSLMHIDEYAVTSSAPKRTPPWPTSGVHVPASAWRSRRNAMRFAGLTSTARILAAPGTAVALDAMYLCNVTIRQWGENWQLIFRQSYSTSLF